MYDVEINRDHNYELGEAEEGEKEAEGLKKMAEWTLDWSRRFENIPLKESHCGLPKCFCL